MALNNAHFLAASRTATDTTDLVDFEMFIMGLCDYWRSSPRDDVAQEFVVDELEAWGSSRTAWAVELEAFTRRVEVELLAALELDQLPPKLAELVLDLETLDGLLATIDNCYASVDRSCTRNDLIYAMARLVDPTIGREGIVSDAVLDFQVEDRFRREPAAPSKPVAFHRPGRAAEEREDGFPETEICSCGECSRRLRK